MQSLWHKKWIGCVLIHHFTLTFFTLGGLNVTFCVVFINKRLRVWKYTNTFEFYKCLNIVCRSCLFLYVTSHNVVILYFSFILIHDPTKSLLLRSVFESTSFSLALLDACSFNHDHQHAWIKILIFSLTQNRKQKRKLVFGGSECFTASSNVAEPTNMESVWSSCDWIYCDDVIVGWTMTVLSETWWNE